MERRRLVVSAFAPGGADDELHVAVERPLLLHAVRRLERPPLDDDVDAIPAARQTRGGRLRDAEVVEDAAGPPLLDERAVRGGGRGEGAAGGVPRGRRATRPVRGRGEGLKTVTTISPGRAARVSI